MASAAPSLEAAAPPQQLPLDLDLRAILVQAGLGDLDQASVQAALLQAMSMSSGAGGGSGSGSGAAAAQQQQDVGGGLQHSDSDELALGSLMANGVPLEGFPSRHLWLGNLPTRPNRLAIEEAFM